MDVSDMIRIQDDYDTNEADTDDEEKMEDDESHNNKQLDVKSSRIKMNIHTNMNCLNDLLTTLLSGLLVKNHTAPMKTKDGRIEYVQINSSMRQVNGLEQQHDVLVQLLRVDNAIECAESAHD